MAMFWFSAAYPGSTRKLDLQCSLNEYMFHWNRVLALKLAWGKFFLYI